METAELEGASTIATSLLTAASSSSCEEPVLDTAVLAQNVTNYLRTNQIQWTRFASLVLGISQVIIGQRLGTKQVLYFAYALWSSDSG